MFDILIIGGGLAGLKVMVIEKNSNPKHKVCGEYISNEVLPYLEGLGINPFQMQHQGVKRNSKNNDLDGLRCSGLSNIYFQDYYYLTNCQ